MPIYAYRCDECGAQKDVLQKISDAPLTKCTQCGAHAFHRVLTAPAFQLKGNGWYVTDFRDKGNGSRPDTARGRSAEPVANAPAASGEAKPAASSSDAAAPAPAPASPSSDA